MEKCMYGGGDTVASHPTSCPLLCQEPGWQHSRVQDLLLPPGTLPPGTGDLVDLQMPFLPCDMRSAVASSEAALLGTCSLLLGVYAHEQGRSYNRSRQDLHRARAWVRPHIRDGTWTPETSLGHLWTLPLPY